MASVLTPRRSRWTMIVDTVVDGVRSLYPSEGFTILLVHLLVVQASAWAMVRADWTSGLETLPLVALAASLVGLILAKAEAPDLASHLTAFWLGLLLVVATTAAAFPELGSTYRDRLQELGVRFETWARASSSDRDNDPALFVILMGMTVWLVSYMSSWTLFRRRWLTSSVVLPGFVILINIGYRPETGGEPLVLYMLAAGTLVAAHFGYRRRLEWRGRNMPAPTSVRWQFLVIGFNAALMLTVAAWAMPDNARAQAFSRTWESLSGPWEQVQERWDEWFDFIDSPGRDRSQTFAQLNDQFDLGGPLDLSETPILVLEQQGGEAPYLAGYRYDHWDGFGWQSEVERTFAVPGAEDSTGAPQITFQAGQPVALSGDVTQARAPVNGEIRVLSGILDSLLVTRDAYVSTDAGTSVRLSWLPLDGAVFPLGGSQGRANLPPDLRQIGGLLSQATFVEGANGEQVPSDAALANRINTTRAELSARFLDVSWQLVDGRVDAIVVTGVLPIYDDIEAVFARTPPAVGETYQIQGLTSLASSAQLREAGTEYPNYISERYLQLPTTVTDRTRERSQQIALSADGATPFDVAIAIQNYLRANITYDEDTPLPPDNQDNVDYVLFDDPRGYCQHYASAMAVMLRTLGIPSRVVSGFLPPSFDDEMGGFVYREQNAHLWVEVYFPGYGWLRFEPTASEEPPDYDSEPQAPPPLPSPTPTVPPTPTPETAPEDQQPTETPIPSPTATAIPPAPDEPEAPAGFTEDSNNWIGPLVAAIVIGLALFAAVIAVAWRWGLGGLSPAGAFYARTLKLGRWLGIRSGPSMTPAEYATELGRTIPTARRSAETVVTAYMSEQYSGRLDTTSHAGETAWRELRLAFLRSLPNRWLPRRWRRGRGGQS